MKESLIRFLLGFLDVDFYCHKKGFSYQIIEPRDTRSIVDIKIDNYIANHGRHPHYVIVGRDIFGDLYEAKKDDFNKDGVMFLVGNIRTDKKMSFGVSYYRGCVAIISYSFNGVVCLPKEINLY